MNIFFLSKCPILCAMWHCNQHCVKMILEYAQVLSTAHRVIDGEMYTELTKAKRKIKRWKLKNPEMEALLYKATHTGHPSVVWVMESRGNYKWLYKLFVCLCSEYKRRYNKTHKSESLSCLLKRYPLGISRGVLSPPPLAMPDEYKTSENPSFDDVVTSYRIFYNLSKSRFARWFEECPWWYQEI